VSRRRQGIVAAVLRRIEARLAALTGARAELLAVQQRLDRLEHGLRESWSTTTEALQRLEHRIARTQQVGGAEIAPLDSVELRNVLWTLVAEEAENRRRLWRARADPDYELAYTEADPLVSILIPTYDRPALLAERAVPSGLRQSYRNVEVVVVGDAAGDEIRQAVASIGDPRVRYHNLTQRIVASDEPRKHWLVAATMTRNEALRIARGRWIVSLDDDDEMHESHVERLLELARERRLEVAYGQLRHLNSDGSTKDVGEFPPGPGRFAWQAALYHAGLRFFERELVAAEFNVPGDRFLLERMLRAGVRFGMTDEVVCTYFPSQG
jgi:hypothetical protein